MRQVTHPGWSCVQPSHNESLKLPSPVQSGYPTPERRARETLTADRKQNSSQRSREVCSLLQSQAIHLIDRWCQPVRPSKGGARFNLWARGVPDRDSLEIPPTDCFAHVLHRSLASLPSCQEPFLNFAHHPSFVSPPALYFRLHSLRLSSASPLRAHKTAKSI